MNGASASRSPPGSSPVIPARAGGGQGAALPPPVVALAPERAVHGDHRRAAGVHGVDDLGVVDALQIDRGDPEVGVPELALDDDQRHAFAGHLDCVRVAQLVLAPTSAQAPLGRPDPYADPWRGSPRTLGCRW